MIVFVLNSRLSIPSFFSLIEKTIEVFHNEFMMSVLKFYKLLRGYALMQENKSIESLINEKRWNLP